MKKFICILVVMCIFISVISVTSFAYLTKGERYKESSSGNIFKPKETFVDKGLPAPIISDPVSYAVDGRINIKLNGKFVYFYKEPVIIDGRVLLPFRELFEFFDMRVKWDDENKTAVADNSLTEIKITVDNNKAYVNGEEKILDVPPMLIDESTYAPLRFVAESLGYSVGWDNREEIVTLSGGGAK